MAASGSAKYEPILGPWEGLLTPTSGAQSEIKKENYSPSPHALGLLGVNKTH